MDTATMTVQELAEEAGRYFESAKRADSDERYTRTQEGTPEWIHDMVQDVHGGMFPDDWKYDCISSALDTISESDDPQDAIGEFADGQVDPYDSDRIEWLASHSSRQGYVDDAVSEFGHSDRGIVDQIALGQYYEANEVYGLVLRALEDRLEEVQS